MQANQSNKIPELVELLCERLREWGEGSEQYAIGDIDKAASTLKKLQDIYATEQGYSDAGENAGVIITHHVPRAEEAEGGDET